MFENFAAFLQNPMMYRMKTKFKIPNEINTPDEIINYLMQSKQLTQDQYGQVISKYKEFQSLGQLPKQPN